MSQFEGRLSMRARVTGAEKNGLSGTQRNKQSSLYRRMLSAPLSTFAANCHDRADVTSNAILGYN